MTPVPDSSSQVISTFVAVYTLFLAGFATLAGFVTKSSAPVSWKIVAVEFLLVASALDLVRTVYSTNELYHSTTGELTSFTLRDDVDDFIRYFAINTIVVAFAVLTSCLSAKRVEKLLDGFRAWTRFNRSFVGSAVKDGASGAK
jgi:hypothetical protein